jgi:transcriptional regulator with XRE-family HTH domain
MDAIKVFATNLKKYRKERGLSQEAFSEKTGLHRTYISAVEREKRNISIDNIQKIADALGIDTYMLFIENQTDNTVNDRKE